LCAIYYNKNSGFEVVHGLLDRVMQLLGVAFSADQTAPGYYLQPEQGMYTSLLKHLGNSC
jgi:phenylalanyl-tRNA synthetase beta chain